MLYIMFNRGVALFRCKFYSTKFIPKYLSIMPKYLSLMPKSFNWNIVNFFKNIKWKPNEQLLLTPKFIYANYIIKRGCKDQKSESSSSGGCGSGSNGDVYNRHMYSPKVEEMINKQINIEIGAGYAYLNMASYFNRSDVALPGFYGFFMKMYYEEQDHALGFIKYQTLRGGIVRLHDVVPLTKYEWPDIADCFLCALDMEKHVKEDILKIYAEAEKSHDTDCIDFLDGYIKDQEKSVWEMSRYVTRAKLIGNSYVGKYLFDREMHETHVRKGPAETTPEIGAKLYA